jgi:hypothetical protein
MVALLYIVQAHTASSSERSFRTWPGMSRIWQLSSYDHAGPYGQLNQPETKLKVQG